MDTTARTMIPVEELTDDDYERAELLSEEYEYIGAGDPHELEMGRIQSELSALKRKVGSKRQRVPFLYMRGFSRQKIAEETNVNYVTICKALNDPLIHRMMALIQRSNQIEAGPSITARREMLWRIAIRNENTNPRVSLTAVDTLNKQEGIYQPIQPGDENRQPRILIQQFLDNTQSQYVPIEQQQQQTVIEGEFTPVTVKTGSQ